MVSGYQNGTIAQLLQAIIGQINFDGEPISNIGDILLSILEQTPYDDEPKSVLAELFLKLKDKLEGRAFTPYDKEPTSVIAEILLSILNETEYDKEPNSRIAELLLELKAKLEDYAEITVSGAIANFNTSLVLPLIDVKAEIKAVETGTGAKSPSNPYVISGFTGAVLTQSGANLWDEVWENGFINASGQETDSTTSIRSKNYCPCVPNSRIYVACPETPTLYLCFFDKNKAFLSRMHFNNGASHTNTVPNNAYYFRVSCYNYGSTYSNNVSVNYPSTETAYKPYTANVYPVSWQTEAGEVFGGYYDFTTGKLVVTWISKDLGDCSWEMNGTRLLSRTGLSNAPCKNASVSTIGNYSSEIYEAINWGYINSDHDYTFSCVGNQILVQDSRYSNAATYKEDIAGKKIIYELATPVEYDLTPQQISPFLGINNIWNDTNGDTTVKYLTKIEDNLRSTAKFRANLKAEKQKLKEQKELKELEEKETIKEPTKEIGDTKK